MNENYSFDINMDVQEALKNVERLDKAVSSIADKKAKSNNIVNQSDIQSAVTGIANLKREYQELTKAIAEARAKTNGDLFEGMNLDDSNRQLASMLGKLSLVEEHYKKVAKGTAVTPNKKFDTREYFVGQERKSYTGIGRDDSAQFKERYASINSKLSRQRNEAERYTSNVKSTGYLNSNDYQKMQQTFQHLKVARKSDKDSAVEDIRTREQKLKHNDERFRDLNSKGSINQEEAEEMRSIVQKNKILKEELDVLEKHMRAIDRATSGIDNMERKLKENLKQVKPERGTALGMAYERAPSLAMAVVGSVVGVAGSQYMRGGSLKKGMLDDNVSVGTQTGDFDYHGVRTSLEKQGFDKTINMSGTEMLQAQSEYMDKAGFQSKEDLNHATANIGTFARGTGLSVQDSIENTSALAQYTQGSNSSMLKGFQNAFVGGLKSSGMIGQNKQQLKALDSIVNNVGSTTGLNEDSVNRLIGLQATFASTGSKSMQGEQGAQAITDMNEGIRGSQDNPLSYSFAQQANPGRYASASGYGRYLKDMNDGITGEAMPALLSSVMDNANTMGGDKDAQIGYVGSFINKSMGTQLQNDQIEEIMGLYKEGKLTQESLTKVATSSEAEGEKAIKDTADKYSESGTATETKFSNVMDAQATAVNDWGTAVKSAITPAYGLTGAFGVLLTASLALGGSLALLATQMKVASTLRGGIGSRGARNAGGNPDAGTRMGRRGGGNPPTGGGGRNGGGGTPPTPPTGGGGFLSNIRDRFRGGGGTPPTPPTGGGSPPPTPPRPPAGGAGAGGTGGAIRGSLGNLASKAPGIGTIAMGLFGAKSLYDQVKIDEANNVTGDEHTKNMLGTGGSALGGVAGAFAGGAMGGALVGSMVAPGVGTAIGGALGATGGAIAGSSAGQWIGEHSVGAWNGVKKAGSWTMEKAKDAGAWTADKASKAWEGTKEIGGNVKDWTTDKLSGLFGGMTASAKEVDPKDSNFFGGEKQDSASRKQEEVTTEKRKNAEEKRAENIRKDMEFVRQYREASLRGMNGGMGTRQGVDSDISSGDVSSEGGDVTETDVSSTDTDVAKTKDAKTDKNKKDADKNKESGSKPKSVMENKPDIIDGTIKILHAGKVATIEDISNNTKNALKFLATLPSANQQTLG